MSLYRAVGKYLYQHFKPNPIVTQEISPVELWASETIPVVWSPMTDELCVGCARDWLGIALVSPVEKAYPWFACNYDVMAT